MIRRSTSAQFVPANAGAKAKNPVGSTLFSTPMVALLRHSGHKILRTCCRESARKRLKRAMTNQGTMTMEGGGGGVSDVLELDSFVSSGATVGFMATFLSDAETSPERGIPTPQGLTSPNILEDGTLQLLTPAGFSVTLPGVRLVNLAVSAQSDAVEGPEVVPEPSTLALLSAGLFGLGILRRRRPRV